MGPLRREMTEDEFWEYPKTLGWKHEYYGGALHLSPAWTAIASFRLDITALLSREAELCSQKNSAIDAVAIRDLEPTDQEPLLQLFCQCFDGNIEYAGYDAKDLAKESRRTLDRFFAEEAPDFLSCCQIATIEERIVGASMIATMKLGPILQPIFVASEYHRCGIAKSLLLASAKKLGANGTTELFSRCNLGNPPSLRWHEKCGFVELPDMFAAGHRANVYSLEAERQERLGLPSAAEVRKLAKYWIAKHRRLQDLGRHSQESVTNLW